MLAISGVVLVLIGTGCYNRTLVNAVQASARTDLDCRQPDQVVNVFGARMYGSSPQVWKASGCDHVVHYLCRSKEGFAPVSLGGPRAVDTGEYTCVRLWIDELVQ